MSTRLDAMMVTKYRTKDGEERTKWTRVGAAFAVEKFNGWSVKLDLPIVLIPGVSDLVLAEPKPKDEGI